MLTLSRLIPGTEATPQIAKTFGAKLQQLSALVRRTRLDFPIEETPIRREWEQIRGSLFADACWFRWSSRDPVATNAPGPPPRSAVRAPTTMERFQAEQILVKAEGLVEAADRHLDLLDQTETLPERVEWVQGWKRELDELTGSLGPEPAGMVDVFCRQFFHDVRTGLGRLAQGHMLPAANAPQLRESRSRRPAPGCAMRATTSPGPVSDQSQRDPRTPA